MSKFVGSLGGRVDSEWTLGRSRVALLAASKYTRLFRGGGPHECTSDLLDLPLRGEVY